MLLNSSANGSAAGWLMTSFITLMNLPIAHAELPIHDVIVWRLRPLMMTSRKRRSQRDNSRDAARSQKDLWIYFLFLSRFSSTVRFGLRSARIFSPLKDRLVVRACQCGLLWFRRAQSFFLNLTVIRLSHSMSWCGVQVRSRASRYQISPENTPSFPPHFSPNSSTKSHISRLLVHPGNRTPFSPSIS